MANSDSSLTPEKRLLKLIEDNDVSGDVGRQPVQKTAPPSKVPINVPTVSPEEILNKLREIKERLVAFAKNEGPPLNLRSINRSVKVFVLGLSIYFTGAIAYEVLTMSNAMNFDTSVTPRPMAKSTVPEGRLYEIDLFRDENRRNVFIPYVEEEKPSENSIDAEKAAISLKVLEITKDLKLTGISVNPADPQKAYCMVEDVKKGMTSFLRVGDTISGLTVAEIKADSIILEYGTEQIELR